ncbi:MAG: RagB/SusD family nutrient uptake outer membrane protein [Bacteroidales bacterium]|jgi:hypothetical protein|nr:RagB/SusD family nutrient uptake outer membrane protein [Bacteroidales bacterium]
MKKIVFLLISVLVLVSCTKDFVTKNPLGTESDVTFFNTVDQCRQAVNAIYDPLAWIDTYGRSAELFDMLSDDAEKGGNPSSKSSYKSDQSFMYEIMLGNTTALNAIIGNFWKNYYVVIARANLMLDKTTDKENVAAYKEMRAEARFLRAFAYMDLVKLFGAVPLVDKVVVSADQAKTIGNRPDGKTADEQIAAIYDFVISELTAIKGHLPMRQPDANFGMATDAAVQAYLAKAYLYAGKFDEAYTTAKSLITSAQGVYGLESEYHKVFDFDKVRDESTIKEIVFAIQYIPSAGYNRDKGGEGTTRVIDCNPRVFADNANDDAVGYGLVIPTKTLVDAFEVGDPRLDLIAKASYKNFEGKTVADSIYWTLKSNEPAKWRKVAKSPQNTGNYTLKHFVSFDVNKETGVNSQAQGKDLIMMRWAEVLLIGAEAAARTGKPEATQWVNDIRKRARESKCIERAPLMADYIFVKTGTIPADLPTVSLEDVKKERQLELFCENGTRYFDLIRWNKTNDGDGISADEVLGAITKDLIGETRIWVPERQGLLPIPAKQLILQGNSLIQNSGY